MKSTFIAACLLIASFSGLSTAVYAASDENTVRPIVVVPSSDITAKIKAKLALQHPSSLKYIKVDTDDKGVVWLSGSASTQAQVDMAGAIARDTDGVRSVQNNLVVREDD